MFSSRGGKISDFDGKKNQERNYSFGQKLIVTLTFFREFVHVQTFGFLFGGGSGDGVSLFLYQEKWYRLCFYMSISLWQLQYVSIDIYFLFG
jgi:hypothetical protein